MKKVAVIFMIVLGVVTSAAGGTLLAADPGPIAPGGSPLLIAE